MLKYCRLCLCYYIIEALLSFFLMKIANCTLLECTVLLYSRMIKEAILIIFCFGIIDNFHMGSTVGLVYGFGK